MASPSSEAGRHLGLHLQHAHAEPAPESAVREAQRWIEAVTGRCFGEKDLRRGLDNGILLCELLSSIKPGLVKKINRLPTPVAGLDNLVLFLRGCEELGLKGSQLFDPGDLQDTSTRPDNKGSESSRKLKNVLITIYWLGRAANGSATFNGPTLDLRQFEGLLAQMRKEAEDLDSPKRSIRDSGYIDCWESERSDSLSPPRHGRDDSFDSLDSIGSRSRQTPSPDVLVARGNSDGRGSDSESDAPHRKMPDVRKDDMLARRTSCSEPRTAVPFNQYLPNKSNQCGYVPTALRRKRADCEDGRKSWSNATSPIGGERPFSESDSSELALPSAVTTLDPHAVDPTPQDPPSKKPSSKVACPKNGRPTMTQLKESPPSDAQTKPLHHGEPPSSPHPSPKPQQASPEEEELEEEEDPAERSPVPPSTDGAVAHAAAPETGRGPPSGSQLPQCTTQPTDLATLRHLTSDPRWHSPSGSPARSCSAELYHTSLVTNAMTTSIIVTSPVSPARSPAMPRRVPSPRPDGGGMVSPSTSTGKDDMWARRTPTSPKHATPSPTHLLPEPTAANQSELTVRVEPEAEKSRKRPSCLDDDLPPAFSHRASVSDDPESVSMIDVRCEEDAMLSPHSQLRHGLMHGQYHRMKEEDDHWQDDLARWKNRRRSVSQDLIKKEEERKMMERLISGEDDSYQRKKSIKTYREIVEDKERRERELHEAYRQARTPEEAASVLQRYAQRFTISEAVLERLKLPKLLDRSVSADPSALCLDPDATAPPAGPLQYLRQRSLPATKFTSMVEARVGSYGPDQSPESSLTPAPANTGTPKVVPLLSPKPYSAAPRTAMSLTHADSAPRVNGETGDEPRRGAEERGRERERERELDCSPLEFFPSPSLATHSDPESAAGPTALPADARAPEHAERPAEVAHTPDSSPGGPGSHSPEQGPEQSREQGTEQGREQAGQEQPGQEQPPSQPTPLPTQELQSEGGAVPQTQGVSSSTKEEEPGAIGVADLPASTDATCSADSLPWPTGSGAHSPDEETPANGNSSAVSQNGVHTELAPAQEDKAMAEVSESGVASPERGLGALNSSNLEPSKTEPVSGPLGTELATSAQQPSLSSNPRLRWEFFAPPEGVQQEQGNVVAPAVLSLVRQGEHVSWDPEEERRRQERWQREQERMLQEKYRREQEKLKQEWERAQKEVEEEERRYHEEEKRILEETVAPLTPHSPAPPSPRHVVKAPPTGPQPPQDTIVRSLADWQRKQELLEKQTSGMAQNWRPDDRINVAESAMPQTSGPLAVSSERQPRVQRGERSQSRGPSPRSSQDGPKSSKQQEPEPWEKTASLDRSKTTQSAPPAGQRRRSSSIENVGPNSSKPSSCSSDTQPPSPNRSVSGKKLCSSCGHPLGKGAAMIIETLSLYFHIQCFKCGICKGQLGDTTTGTDVRIRNGLLNCHQCYLRSRSAGQPTTL